MENASLSSDVWDNVTTSSSKDDDDLTLYLANIRDTALKIVYIIIGTVGVIDNLFVLVIFVLFVKITDKVLASKTLRKIQQFLSSFLLGPSLPVHHTTTSHHVIQTFSNMFKFRLNFEVATVG